MNQISLLLVFGIIRVMRVVGFWFMTPIFPAVTVSLPNEANQDQDGALGFFSSSKSTRISENFFALASMPLNRQTVKFDVCVRE